MSTETDAFSAKGELLHSNNEKRLETKTISKFDLIKYIAFSTIWAFVAWNLLTVKEKRPTEYGIVIEANKTKGKTNANG